jgi:hypothetical protein
LTASTPAAIRLPVHFDSDRECIETIARTVGQTDLSQVTICRVRNTLELSLAEVTENLLPVIRANGNIEILSEPAAFDFDADGNLPGKLASHQAPQPVH